MKLTKQRTNPVGVHLILLALKSIKVAKDVYGDDIGFKLAWFFTLFHNPSETKIKNAK